MIVLDIRCPECDRVDTVEKVGIGHYRCRDCSISFSRTDLVDPE